MSRKNKRRKGFGLAIIEFILALIILGAGFVGFAYFFCPLKNVEVTGTDLYTKEEITGYILDDEYSNNAMYVFIKNKLFPKGDAEFIDSFDVKLKNLNTVEIHCNEKKILGYMQNDDMKYIYFNYQGIIAEISETYVEGYMKLEGVSCQDPKVGDKLSLGDNDEVGYLMSLIKLIYKTDLMPDKIVYDENSYITLVYSDYNIVLGSQSYLEEKIDRLQYILPQIEGMKGTLHLENFSNTNTDIVFEKAAEVDE
ncbi:MAG: hypothetical protein K5773_02040 [Pseudobutyrivibrio sp.]|nr:hypothetical protein [Pseudobutyrivibrio sp.]